VVGKGTYGTVYKATNRQTKQVVALKKLKVESEQDGFPKFAIREIKILGRMNHPCVTRLLEVVMSRNKDEVFMVFEYMQHDLAGLIASPEVRFTDYQVKLYMRQVLEGLEYMHREKLLHRDIKSANMLVNDSGCLKLADFGMSRDHDETANECYTQKVVTLWYRPPEILLGAVSYTNTIDIWSVGVVFAELVGDNCRGGPFLRGNSELQQLEIIFRVCGSPSEQWSEHAGLPEYPALRSICMKKHARDLRQHRGLHAMGADAMGLLETLLALDPMRRPSATLALQHPYFAGEPAVDLRRIDVSRTQLPKADTKELGARKSQRFPERRTDRQTDRQREEPTGCRETAVAAHKRPRPHGQGPCQRAGSGLDSEVGAGSQRQRTGAGAVGSFHGRW